MQILNIDTLPLTEKVLIEASAGTGKTYTIGLIVLRLLLEKLLPIEKIVLVTFTEAATAELKKKTAERIRERYAKDSKILTLQQKANLQDAIARIDEMPVFTIHGFCKRLLSEFAFEVGNFEEMEIITNQKDIENRIVADFWRHEIEKLKDAEIEILPQNFSPEILKTGIANVINFPNAKIECKTSDSLVSNLQHKIGKGFLEALQAEKKKLNVMGFSDLIMNAYNATQKDNEKILFKAVQKRYEAILIDEFQDTDKMQYKIFSYLFEGKPFFVIGDPKQAIYRFRGGDIYAYLTAKQELKHQYTLNKSYRTQKRLLRALNTIFKVENPFGHKDIEYINIDSGKEDLPELTINGEKQKPLVMRNAEYANKEQLKPIKQEIIQEIILLLYKTDTEINNRRIKARDIAILTASNKDAKQYRNALKKENIPAIIRRSDSVFKSNAADYIMRLLRAFVYSQKESCVKAALMEPRKLSTEDIKPFAEAFDIWKSYGIMRAINSFFDSNGFWGKILSAENGERNATNIRQLIWILNEEETAFGRVPERMLRRFSELIENGGGEETEEKLETDDDAVQIMTIHASKGLEFPVVFIPDISSKIRQSSPYVYHSENDIIVEYAKDEKTAKSTEKKELLEESARNFYVAVTRPIFRLYIVNAHKKTLSSAGQKICGKISEDENIQVVSSFADIEYPKSSGSNLEEEKNKSLKPPKTKDFQITPAWQQTSFTAISRNLEHVDHTCILPETEIKIPAGKMMGNLLHAIFEKMDFDASEKEIRSLVESKLGGFKEFSKNTDEGKKRIAWVEKQIKIILNKNLGNAGKLCEIDSGNRVTELNFFMKSENADLKKIKEIMKEKILDFESENLLAKYITGAMDLVFLGRDEKYYILDWKSNSLGDFSEAGMEEAMLHSAYHLQYSIYAVALKRWLEQTHENFNFKEKFGGAYYIFIRGINEENSNGIYFSSGELIADSIKDMDELFKKSAYSAAI